MDFVERDLHDWVLEESETFIPNFGQNITAL